MEERFGFLPGVVALVAEGDMLCVECAVWLYDLQVVKVVSETAEYEQYTDAQGRVFKEVLYGSEDLHGHFCAYCGGDFCEWFCWCRTLPSCWECMRRFEGRELLDGLCKECRRKKRKG